MRLQSAIFDMDGTLVDSMPTWRNAAANVLRSMGIEPAPDIHSHISDLTVFDGAKYCVEAYHLDMTVQQFIQRVDDLMEDFYRNEVELKPGAKKFLSLLKMEGVWMYVATNTDRHLVEIALKRTGIADYFRGILTCGEVGIGKKESPEIYERALRRLRSTKKDTVVFEDALFAIRTAKAAGFRVCAVYDDFEKNSQDEIRALSDYYIRSFEEMFESETLG